MKKAGYLFGLAAYVIGAIGGIGYSIYSRAYIIAICVAVLAGMALPTAKKWYKSLIDG